jgi:hypothetical protein
MALPGKLGAALAAGMGKKGLMSAAPPDDDDEPAADAGDDGGLDAVIDDMDRLVPGLGKLMAEFADRIQAKDEEQDADEMG